MSNLRKPKLKTMESDQILSVSDFNARVKTILENEIPPCWVRGEVSNLRHQSSGHIYFSLKDANSQISAVLFKGYAAQISLQLAEGMQILVFGEINVYEPRGQYQLIARFILEDGQGQLQLEFNRLKEKLANEGLFDTDKKKSLPPIPRTIGFITSPTGAAIRDFISILKRRGWQGTVIIFPSNVQGTSAAAEMIEQLRIAQEFNKLDLLVIGRGGGSIEDLWAFNEEPLVRAVAACTLPIISAVGHEIDFVLTDFAADKRAETPSAAAELISSLYLDCVSRVNHIKKTLHPSRFSPILENYALKLDDKENRLYQSLTQRLRGAKDMLKSAENRLSAISPAHSLRAHNKHVEQLHKRLESCNPANILNRGYAWVQGKNKVFIENKASAQKEAVLTITFKDGQIEAERL
ncbi:MAG: exodeoxyribonuclease VII large subunit [Verrucomicrobia bacterium CG_4_10_14_3_um_filter_43_23]|nr:MAG: exodeoxyribonuclease VII large subunit [Verrucomicrobia bacterium CG22_combo_CG10-13_8_21_14_all_43_17]PIX58964.1 MAG: exodeoxyribonuclease VII large subunit [Verrucomicrobia bacterium CG_4_10_14_3_um_filter_43_23]PIY63108.1 MAG: exodeoxyribonuclease VII large subunit [Verrucomicrobia bacterium CG_4_10_14_0_8_um_filter_43_34]PJA43616.1 MAG: exodeoxyribonuclease VII large subunit [Verrucomicrobia bacterium CG_4_9_14_3_um_filter_43_20]